MPKLKMKNLGPISMFTFTILFLEWVQFNERHNKSCFKGPCSPKWLCALVLLFWNTFLSNAVFWFADTFTGVWGVHFFSCLAKAWLYTYWRQQFSTTKKSFFWITGCAMHLGWTWAFKRTLVDIIILCLLSVRILVDESDKKCTVVG